MSSAYLVMGSMLILLLAIYLTEHKFHKFVEKGFLSSSLTVGLVVLTTYAIALAKPRLESPIGKVLGDRLYLPFLNDFVVPKLGWALAKLVDYGNRAIDFFCHKAIPDSFNVASRSIRKVQSGSVERYLKISVAVILLLIVIAIALGVVA